MKDRKLKFENPADSTSTQAGTLSWLEKIKVTIKPVVKLNHSKTTYKDIFYEYVKNENYSIDLKLQT